MPVDFCKALPRLPGQDGRAIEDEPTPKRHAADRRENRTMAVQRYEPGTLDADVWQRMGVTIADLRRRAIDITAASAISSSSASLAAPASASAASPSGASLAAPATSSSGASLAAPASASAASRAGATSAAPAASSTGAT